MHRPDERPDHAARRRGTARPARIQSRGLKSAGGAERAGDRADEVHDPRPPARGDRVVDPDDRAGLYRGHVLHPGRAATVFAGCAQQLMSARTTMSGLLRDDVLGGQLRIAAAAGRVGRVGDVLQAEQRVDPADEGVRRGRVEVRARARGTTRSPLPRRPCGGGRGERGASGARGRASHAGRSRLSVLSKEIFRNYCFESQASRTCRSLSRSRPAGGSAGASPRAIHASVSRDRLLERPRRQARFERGRRVDRRASRRTRRRAATAAAPSTRRPRARRGSRGSTQTNSASLPATRRQVSSALAEGRRPVDRVEGPREPRLGGVDDPRGEVAHVDDLERAAARRRCEHLPALGDALRPVGEAAGRIPRADDQPGPRDERIRETRRARRLRSAP